jgi:hypothetical protein
MLAQQAPSSTILLRMKQRVPLSIHLHQGNHYATNRLGKGDRSIVVALPWHQTTLH